MGVFLILEAVSQTVRRTVWVWDGCPIPSWPRW